MRILSHLLDAEFPGAIWSGRLTPSRHDRLLAAAFGARPGETPATLVPFPLDGRPNSGTRDLLTALLVCKRWRRVAREHVIQHCAVFGASDAAAGVEADSEDAEKQSEGQDADDALARAQVVAARPDLQLASLVMVVSAGLPIALDSTGAMRLPCSTHPAGKQTRGGCCLRIADCVDSSLSGGTDTAMTGSTYSQRRACRS